MAKRRFVRRGGTQPQAKAPVARKQVEPEDLEELEDEVDDVEEEEVTPRRSRRVVETDDETEDVGADEDEDYDEDDDEDEEYYDDEDDEPAPVAKVVKKKVIPPAPAKKAAPVAAKKPVKPAPKAAPVAAKKATKPAPREVEPVATVKKVDQVVAENVLFMFLEALDTGCAVMLTKVNDSKWQFAKVDASKLGGRKMGSSQAWNLMVSDEYRAWVDSWNEKTYDEKKAYAKKLKLKWPEHENPQIDVMRITQAVRAHDGVEKYKPEFRTRAARAAFRSQ